MNYAKYYNKLIMLQTKIETIEKNIILYLLLVKGFKQNVNVQISKYITYGSYKKI